jgi:hypothetical protein
MPRVEPDFHDGLGCALNDEFAKTVGLGIDLVGPPLYDMIWFEGGGEPF